MTTLNFGVIITAPVLYITDGYTWMYTTFTRTGLLATFDSPNQHAPFWPCRWSCLSATVSD